MEFNIKQFEGGGIRENPEGKTAYNNISFIGLKRLAQRCEYGGRKYGVSDNYKAGLPTLDSWNSAFRHLIAYIEGDNSEDHLAACAWNCFAIMECEVNHPEFQNIKSRQRYQPDDLNYEGGELK